jgi:hypothetical protein
MPRPVGSYGRLRRRAEELFARHDFDPLYEKIHLAQVMRAKLLLADGQDDALTIQWASLYQKCLQDLCGIYSRIKMIEFTEEPTEVRRSPDALQIEMVQQIAWQLGHRFEPKLEDDREPMPALQGPANGGRPKVEVSTKRERSSG